MKVRTVLLATVSTIAMLGIASAADMAVKAPAPSSPQPQTGRAGYYCVHWRRGVAQWAFNNELASNRKLRFFNSNGGPAFWKNGSKIGATAGGHIGYNWQSDQFRLWVERMRAGSMRSEAFFNANQDSIRHQLGAFVQESTGLRPNGPRRLALAAPLLLTGGSPFVA